jgi:2-oxoglutarate ferredoxin oxidoreductase subunit alpha
MPTKPEQADLLMVLYGRNSESPVPVVAAATPGECFDAAIEAARIALKYRTPVFLLSDAYLANGSEPWLLPDVASLPDISSTFATEPNSTATSCRTCAIRDARAAVGGAGHARARAPDRRPREGGRHRQRLVRPRQPRPDGAAARAQGRGHRADIPELEVDDPDGARCSCSAGAGRTARSPRRAPRPQDGGRSRTRTCAPEPVPAQHRRRAAAYDRCSSRRSTSASCCSSCAPSSSSTPSATTACAAAAARERVADAIEAML